MYTIDWAPKALHYHILFDIDNVVKIIAIQEVKNAMNAPINFQTIWQDGKPAFVVIPYEEFVRLFPPTPRIPEGDAIPHEVVKLHIQENMSIVRAWREYLSLTQQHVAAAMGVSQAALSQMEAPGARLRRKTLEKLAAALGVSVEQLR